MWSSHPPAVATLRWALSLGGWVAAVAAADQGSQGGLASGLLVRCPCGVTYWVWTLTDQVVHAKGLTGDCPCSVAGPPAGDVVGPVGRTSILPELAIMLLMPAASLMLDRLAGMTLVIWFK